MLSKESSYQALKSADDGHWFRCATVGSLAMHKHSEALVKGNNKIKTQRKSIAQNKVKEWKVYWFGSSYPNPRVIIKTIKFQGGISSGTWQLHHPTMWNCIAKVATY